MLLTKLDHLVLTVRDIEKTVSFYESVLGMRKEFFGNGRVAVKFGQQKINFHQLGNEPTPKATHPTPGSADLCFLTSMNIIDAMNHVESFGVKIIEGPVARTGANGPLQSFYFRDPDLNLIEVATEN